MSELKDATYWAEKIRMKEISSKELFFDTLKRIEEKNPSLNALIEVRADLTEKWIEEHVQGDGLFDGVLFPLKMLGQDKAGLGATMGSKLFEKNVAQSDDYYVKQAEKAGFIPFGKTNAPEFGFKNTTDPQLYGPTKNVWNHAYYPGGSSGGAASAVASGMFPIAGGGDGGGSIRIPASWSGLIGLKPTRGRTPKGPGGYRGWQGASVEFALTVSVRDTARFLAEMQVIQEPAPYQAPLLDRQALLNLQARTLPSKIAFTTQSPVGTPVSEEAKKAVLKAVKFLEAQGHIVEEVDYPLNARPLIETYYQMNAGETLAMIEFFESKLKRKVKKNDIELMTWCLLEYGKNIKATEYIKSLNDWDWATEQFEQKIFSHYDFFLTPTTAKTAPKITHEMFPEKTIQQMEHMNEFSVTEQKQIVSDMFEESLVFSPFPFMVNLTGQTAISLPIYVTDEGLPLGVQFMGRKGSEMELLELSKLFEEAGQFELPEYYR
ncbi:MAG: amidase [Lactobacillales bacterium]|jgi:amidase|nr:amidase [Lactobacillales bacterium]